MTGVQIPSRAWVNNMKKNDININIVNHELIPKHSIVTEREEIFNKYGIKKISQLPRIVDSDPVVKAMGANPGDVIKIVRKSSTAGESIYYRAVVEA